MTGVLSLLHKGDPLTDQPTHWRPVVLLNSMNQLLAYIINERLMELVEHERILTQAQDGFRQDKSTDINACKLYDLTWEAQRLKRRFLRVDIDFKSAFNSMRQASLWVTLEVYGIPDVDPLLFSLFINTLSLCVSDIGRKKRPGSIMAYRGPTRSTTSYLQMT
jgi:hypothetical protein